MRTGRPTPPIVLTAEERQTLEQWARRPTTAQGLAQRARLILACATAKTNGDIAVGAGVTVLNWATVQKVQAAMQSDSGPAASKKPPPSPRSTRARKR